MNPSVLHLLNSTYKKVFPVKNIIRFTREENPHILDQKFHIDVILKLKNGLQLTIQEKVRRESYLDFNDFTLEYESNTVNGTKGEFFKLCTDLYTYGWINHLKTRFLKLYIFKVFPFKLAVTRHKINGKLMLNKKHSNANFYAYSFDNFPKDWFVVKMNDQKQDINKIDMPKK